MRSDYKLLGSFIRPVDNRNRNEEDLPLLGVSVQKVFIPSIANTVGTDFSKYKKVKFNQFTYIPDTSRRGDKIGIAMLSVYDEALVSQAYTVFEIIDHSLLDPSYLMMWFRRPEFDRYARFKSHGSVREIFDWQELCETELPIPTIEKQREIVREYNTIVNRIALNEQFIQKLEETAQTIYKRWFVEFEFPDENGKPYLSSGGKMVWCEELEKEIPEGWVTEEIGNVIDYKKGYAFKSSDYTNKGINIIRVSDLGNRYVENSRFYKIHINKLYDSYKVKKNDFIITTVGSWPSNPLSIVGKLVRIPTFADGYYLNQNMVRIRFSCELSEIAYQQLIDKSFSEYLIKGAQGSANQASITLDHIFKFRILIPQEKLVRNLFIEIYNKIDLSLNENQKLEDLKELILSKMTKVEETRLIKTI